MRFKIALEITVIGALCQDQKWPESRKEPSIRVIFQWLYQIFEGAKVAAQTNPVYVRYRLDLRDWFQKMELVMQNLFEGWWDVQSNGAVNVCRIGYVF